MNNVMREVNSAACLRFSFMRNALYRWADATPRAGSNLDPRMKKGRDENRPAFDSLLTSVCGITSRSKELVLHMMVQLEHSS